MLETLNTDCLLEICQYLNVSDHISLFFTSEYLSAVVEKLYRSETLKTNESFWEIMQYEKDKFTKFWNAISINLKKFIFYPKRLPHYELLRVLKPTRLTDFEYYDKLHPESHALPLLLESQCSNLQNLTLLNMNWRCISLLQDLEFYKCTHFNLHLRPYQNYEDEEEVVNGNINLEMFPKLATLSLTNLRLSQDLLNFTSLTELNIVNCKNLSPEQVEYFLLKNPLKKLKIWNRGNINYHGSIEMENCYKIAIRQCQTLEELSLDYHHYSLFESELMKLKNLQKLHILKRQLIDCDCKNRPISEEVAEYLGKRAKTLSLRLEHSSELQLFQTILHSLFNVQNLKIESWIRGSDNLSGLAVMDNLIEFCYAKFVGEMDYNDVFSVLKCCKNIEVMDFVLTIINKHFLRAASKAVRDFCGHRRSPLLWRFHANNLRLENLNDLAPLGYLHIISYKNFKDDPGLVLTF